MSLDAKHLWQDLQQINDIAHQLSSSSDPEVMVRSITDGLVERFGCALARIWVVEPDGLFLKLLASSGLYTRTNGTFARVPMGAFKVGKIAQNRVTFLSNNLPDETWVKDRDWAIANQIQGFAGFPLMTSQRVVGVLAIFCRHPLRPEFLEVLRLLSTTTAVSLHTALQYQQHVQTLSLQATLPHQAALSDQLASYLGATALVLVGTEPTLSPSLTCVVLRLGEVLQTLQCRYCRLMYEATKLILEATVTIPNLIDLNPNTWIQDALENLPFMIFCLGGQWSSHVETNGKTLGLHVQIPYGGVVTSDLAIHIQCTQPILDSAFRHLAYAAGLKVLTQCERDCPFLTDDITLAAPGQRLIWVQQTGLTQPKGIHAKIDFSIQPQDLREVVVAVKRGETWGLAVETSAGLKPSLSERESEILQLLTQGLRDRDIASALFISENTVKFHMNNILSKLNARTRYQALHLAFIQGWI